MTDPDERDAPALVDELLGPAPEAADPGRVARRRRPVVRAERIGCRHIALATAGFGVFILVDAMMMYTPFRMREEPSLLPQLFTLVLLAFGLGGLLIWQVRGVWRPFGIGLMLGWVFMTLISAGFLTGFNP